MKQDGRKNNGGNKNAGRKPKVAEIKKIEMMDNVLPPKEAWEALAALVLAGDTNATKYWIDQRFGKAKESIDVKTIDPIKSIVIE